MINKTQIYASAGTTAGASSAGYTTGMIPQTVAKAEDVNLYMGMSDQQLYSVCKEIVNLLQANGISPNANSYTQLVTMFDEKIKNTFALTGIDKSSYTSAPTQSGNSITFPTMKIMFNKDVYYGQTDSRHQVTTLAAQTLSANGSWGDGVHFIYASTTAGSSVCTLGHQQTPVSAADGATKCMLGSVFVISGAFQANSWKFQPWLQITSVERRESPTALTKGGFVSAASATTLQMGALEIQDEGINFDADPSAPNITTVPATAAFSYKFLYPGYNASASAVTTLDTTHFYNLTTNAWAELPASITGDTNPHYVVMVPCVVPTGQTLMIPPMSNSSYTQVFDSIDDAINSIYGLQYNLGNVTKRAIYLGESLIVKVGATDLQDPAQCLPVGMVPQALAGFTSASGQAGGGIPVYRPMPLVDWTGSSSFTAQNNAGNYYLSDSASDVTITLPTPQSNVINQLEVQFVKQSTGDIIWNTQITWYTGSALTFTQGNTYNIILEYINGEWFGGVLGIGV